MQNRTDRLGCQMHNFREQKCVLVYKQSVNVDNNWQQMSYNLFVKWILEHVHSISSIGLIQIARSI